MSDHREPLQETARKIGRQVAALRAARKAPLRARRQGGWGRGWRAHPDKRPRNAVAFLQYGGMEMIEPVAASKAAARAIRDARTYWLPILERWLAEEPDEQVRAFLAIEVKCVRRRLGRKPSPATVRKQGRDRVRRFRERQRKPVSGP